MVVSQEAVNGGHVMASSPSTEGVFPPPLQACPRCGAPDLEVVTDGEATNFFCPQCATCWHVELGFVHRVDITTCPGCEHQPTCVLRKALERAETGWIGEERT